MRIRVGLLFVVVGGLLAACAAPATRSKNQFSRRLRIRTHRAAHRPYSSAAGSQPGHPADAYTIAFVAYTYTRLQARRQPSRQIVPFSLDATAVPTPVATTATLGDDPAMLEALLVATINQVRAANGLPPYQHSPELSGAARAHSCDLASPRSDIARILRRAHAGAALSRRDAALGMAERKHSRRRDRSSRDCGDVDG